MQDDRGGEGLDTLRLVQDRAKWRGDRRKMLERIESTTAGLQSASGNTAATSIRAARNFSDPKVIDGVLKEAAEAASMLGTLTKSIASLEQELAAAKSAALKRKIGVAVILVVALGIFIAKVV